MGKRTRREPFIHDQVWGKAADKAKTDATHMTITRTLEVLLASFVDGKITATGRLPQREGNRARHPVNIDSDVWNAAQSLMPAGVTSMGGLCELLLDGYAKGRLTVTVSASGSIGDGADT
ncbi:hypothetical protein [Streptomyces hydrogenans]|uniref:hypothetical protein n=1 Tax=Streptomyces hydrogenans TaxID=1873719 RepID=UPI003817D95D